jgi:hypothetical protein
VLEWHYEASGLYCFVAWDGESRVRLRRKETSEDDAATDAELVFDDGRWWLVPPEPTGNARQ